LDSYILKSDAIQWSIGTMELWSNENSEEEESRVLKIEGREHKKD